MRPLSNHLLVERVKTSSAITAGGIHLPAICEDDNNTGGPKEYRVLAVGPGKRNHKGVVIPIECGPGDRILCHSYTTGVTELKDGRLVLTDDMILAVIPLQS